MDGRVRSFAVHVSAHAAGARLPLVFAFHGRGETPESLARYSGLSRLHAIVIYPRGWPGRGGKLGWSGTPTADPGVDDVRFVLAVLDRIGRLPCSAGGRAFATGKSDGGGLAAQLACVAARRFAAVAPVAGAYYPIAGGCRPAQAVAVLEIHGAADRVIPFAGIARRGLPSVAGWLAQWARRDGCAAARRARHPAGGITLERWAPCRDGTRVEGIRLADGGHTWPGAGAYSGPGVTSRALDATGVIGAFFAGFAR